MKYLRGRGVPFTAYNIEKSRKAAKRKRELSEGYNGVPFAMIYGKPVRGFSPELYEQALRRK